MFGQGRARSPPTRGGGRGSVSAASRGSYSKSGNTGSWQGQRASGSRSVSQTGEGYNVNKQVQTQSGASKSVNKDVNTQDPSVERTSTATNAWGQSASRERTVEGQGGYATVEGSAKTSTGREASGEAVAGRNAYGQPVVAGSVNTKYNGSYAGAAAKNPYGGWNTATVGPVRRQGHDDAALGLQDVHLLRSALLLVRWGLLPALHVWRRAPLLPGPAARTTRPTRARPRERWC